MDSLIMRVGWIAGHEVGGGLLVTRWGGLLVVRVGWITGHKVGWIAGHEGGVDC